MLVVRRVVPWALVMCLCWAVLPAQEKPAVSPSLFSELRWRNIGPAPGEPHRGGRGASRQPYTFYMAQVNGGVWKTTDAGRTWKPIFDDQPTGSIGAIAVAPSDPNIVYVGSGEGLQRPDLSTGDGVYKSTDAGKTWTHLGLRDAQQIPQHRRRSAQPEPAVRRGARPSRTARTRSAASSARPTAAGRSQKVLYKDENTGGNDVDIDPVESRHRLRDAVGSAAGAVGERACGRAPAAASSSPPTAARTWKPLTNGLPTGRSRRTSRSRRRIRSASTPPSPAPTAGLLDSARHRRHLSQRRRGRDWTRINADTRPDRPHRRRRSADAACRTRRIPTSLIVGEHRVVEVDRRRQDAGRRSRARPAARTIRTAGSIPTTPTSCCSPPTRAPSSRSTAARRGAPGTTSRRRRCITSPPTTRSRTASAAASRRAARRASSSRGNYGAITFRDWHAGRRRRVRLRRARSARSRHRLRRPQR